MSSGPQQRLRRRDLAWLLLALLFPLPWIGAHLFDGAGLASTTIAATAGLAILGAAFLLSWSMELAERDIPQSMALLVLALVGVLPEYAVDVSYALKAAHDPVYAHYAVANMTGANRLLIGVGWCVVVLIACQRSGDSSLRIEASQRVEMRFLLYATIYAFLVPLDGYLSLLDAAILLGLFGWYVATAMRGESQHVELIGPPAVLDAKFEDRGRRVWVVLLFLFAGYAIFVSAEPFAESLVQIGKEYDVDEFLLVQWVAPLASESPEFIVAILFAVRARASVGLGALISSKVNQWTLLVGALPLAFVFAGGGFRGLPLDDRQMQELLLTSAQSLLATVLICNFQFSRIEAVMLMSLFAVQLVFPDPAVRIAFAVLYIVIAGGLLVHSPVRRQAVVDLFRGAH